MTVRERKDHRAASRPAPFSPSRSIPRVRLLNENGRTVAEGWYFEHPRRCGGPIADADWDTETVCGVTTYSQGDWGRENRTRIVYAMKGWRFEPAE